MFYHPHFCCHCGEKIVRARWTPLTSRRFCDFCAVEQKQHDLIPRAVAVLLLLFGAAGFTAYLSSGKSVAVSNRPRTENIKALKSEPNAAERGPVVADTSQHAPSSSRNEIAERSRANSAVENKQRPPQRNSSTETVYYCGAMTKKGTACTRRVKTPGRCWQHLGQPAEISSQ